MKKLTISCVEISDYGNLSNSVINTNDKNIILIYGKNEAGKSTIFSFIRNTLSGYPNPTKKDYSHYSIPSNSNTINKLHIKLDDLSFILSREGKVGKDINIEYSSDLKIGKDEIDKLKLELNNINPDEYRNVFGFNISELSSLSFLEDSSLGEKLISAGILGETDIFATTYGILAEDHECLIRKKFNTKNPGILESLNNELKILNGKLQHLKNVKENNNILCKNLINIEQELEESKDLITSMNLEVKQLDSLILKEKSYLELFKIRTITENLSDKRFLSNQEEEVFKKAIIELEILSESILKVDNKLEELIKEKEKLRISTNKQKFQHNIFNNKKNLLLKYNIILFTFLVIIESLQYFYKEFSEYVNLISIFPIILLLFNLKKIKKEEAKLSEVNLSIEQELDLEMIFDSKISENNLNKEELNNSYNKKISTLFSIASFLNSEFGDLSSLKKKISENCTLREESQRIFNLEEKLFKDLEIDNYSTVENSLLDIKESKENKINLESMLKEIQDSISFKFSEKGRIMSLIDSGSSDLEISTLENEIDRKKDEATRLLNIWRRDKLSEYILKRSYENLSNAHVKELFSYASEIFSKMTSEKYSNIRLSNNKKSIIVSTDERSENSLDKLSRGTIEQLYLSLRLALIRRYSMINIAYPTLLDDILVNFDENRTINTLKAFEHSSKSSQIFLFTCHKWIKDLFINTVQDGKVIDIS